MAVVLGWTSLATFAGGMAMADASALSGLPLPWWTLAMVNPITGLAIGAVGVRLGDAEVAWWGAFLNGAITLAVATVLGVAVFGAAVALILRWAA